MGREKNNRFKRYNPYFHYAYTKYYLLSKLTGWEPIFKDHELARINLEFGENKGRLFFKHSKQIVKMNKTEYHNSILIRLSGWEEVFKNHEEARINLEYAESNVWKNSSKRKNKTEYHNNILIRFSGWEGVFKDHEEARINLEYAESNVCKNNSKGKKKTNSKHQLSDNKNSSLEDDETIDF